MSINITRAEMETYCAERGFITPSAGIYGGMRGLFDYGPMGVELKNNLKRAWWQSMVYKCENVHGLDAAIITHPDVLIHSGHVDTFTDPMVECKETNQRYRADKTIVYTHSDEKTPWVAVYDGDDLEAIKKRVEKITGKDVSEFVPQLLSNILEEDFLRIVGPDAKVVGSFTELKSFNMMFQTTVGPVDNGKNTAYLRPETAQSIFTNFEGIAGPNAQLPLGIAQIGKAFRNEITPKNFIFRSREFEQMELEYFVLPENAQEAHAQWVKARVAWWKEQGVTDIQLEEQTEADLAHYSAATTDILFRFAHGYDELEGIANRTDYDLASHANWKKLSKSGSTSQPHAQNKASKAKNTVLHPVTGKPVIPYVIEPSCGVDRGVLAVLTEAFTTHEGGNSKKRVVLELPKHLAPVKVCVTQVGRSDVAQNAADLAANDLRGLGIGLVERARSRDIGKTYAREDSRGTPLTVTFSEKNLAEGSVTIRHRDDPADQETLPVANLKARVQDIYALG